MTAMVTAKPQEMTYCPGCSHGTVLERIGAALERLGLRPEEVCLVSDIGCIGTADRYFACHTFHGLHGRSITYAEGIKRRCPELMVIVLIGDGGCGIGTAHLVHTARRGVGVKVLVCNNFNFGMTGGQHSPTTPVAGLTSTTPGGSADPPLDLCQLTMAAGGSFVARCSAPGKDLDEYLDRTLRAPGFALLDIWEFCTAYYTPQNKLTVRTLAEMSDALKMPFGVLRDEPPPVPPAGPAASGGVRSRPESSSAAPPELLRLAEGWPPRVEVALAGSAGERIRSAAGVIGELLVGAGLHVAQVDDYPISVRKGYSLSSLVISPRPIRHTGLGSPDLVIIQSIDGLQRIGSLAALPESALVIIAEHLAAPATSAAVERIDPSPLSREVGKANVALALLSFGLIRRGWATGAALEAAAQAGLRGRFREESLRAIAAGVALKSD